MKRVGGVAPPTSIFPTMFVFGHPCFIISSCSVLFVAVAVLKMRLGHACPRLWLLSFLWLGAVVALIPLFGWGRGAALSFFMGVASETLKCQECTKQRPWM